MSIDQPRYHINNERKVLRCRATKRPCHFGEHYDSSYSAKLAVKEEEIKTLLETSQPQPKLNKKLSSSNPYVNQALQSNLDYDGQKPEWWDSFVKEQQNHSYLPQTPELLDVIDSPIGSLAVIWENVDQNDKMIMDSGYGLHSLKLLDLNTGEKKGYMKIAYQDEESLARSFGEDEFSPFRYLTRYGSGGRLYGVFDTEKDGSYGSRNLSDEETILKRREVWLACALEGNIPVLKEDGSPTYRLDLTKDDLPDDDKIKEDLDLLSKKETKEINRKVDNFYKHPYIDFSRVDENGLKGTGIGASLYIYAAKRLAKDNKFLRGSSLQSDPASTLWSKFENKLGEVVSEIKLSYKSGEITTHKVLDFRQPV